MFDYSATELVAIDQSIEPKLAWAQTRAVETEQMALDATRLLSCTEDRLNEYMGQGFFKRCWYKLCGKQGEIQRANQRDLIEMQKYSWRYINLLQERDLLLAHSIITVKNNLITLAVAQEETRKEITRMVKRIYERFEDLEKRVKDLEVTSKIHDWLLTIDTYDYDEKFPPYFRLLRVIGDFFSLKEDYWNIVEIRHLQQAIKEVDLPWKKEIKLSEFIDELIDEIEEYSFSQYQNLLHISDGQSGKSIPEAFILENISAPSYTSLYQIADSYSNSSATIDISTEPSNIEKKEAIKRVIKEQGVDLEISIPLRDLAVELLGCMKLTKDLFGLTADSDKRRAPKRAEKRCAGTVKWYNIVKGYGFIRSDDTDYFVHVSDISLENATVERVLIEGETVTFSPSTSKQGPKALRVTPDSTFKNEREEIVNEKRERIMAYRATANKKFLDSLEKALTKEKGSLANEKDIQAIRREFENHYVPDRGTFRWTLPDGSIFEIGSDDLEKHLDQILPVIQEARQKFVEMKEEEKKARCMKALQEAKDKYQEYGTELGGIPLSPISHQPYPALPHGTGLEGIPLPPISHQPYPALPHKKEGTGLGGILLTGLVGLGLGVGVGYYISRD